jgi:hypothetical protein
MRSSFCLPKSLSISGRSGGIRKLHTPFSGRDDADRAGLFCPGTRTGVREPVSILSFQQGKNVASISFYEGKNHQNIIVVAPRARVRAVEILASLRPNRNRDRYRNRGKDFDPDFDSDFDLDPAALVIMRIAARRTCA